MTTSSETLYYVLREGSTREERWSWSDVEQLCRSGELTARARIFLPEEERWAAIGETRLSSLLSDVRPGDAATDDEATSLRASVEQEYKAVLERIAGGADDTLEAQLDAGILASELGLRDESRSHFQAVLHRYPYHARAAQEIRRRFGKGEQKSFRYLERPPAVWEDVSDLWLIPFARGPLYAAVPAAVFAALAWVPGGTAIAATIMFLWAFQVMEYTARGANQPAVWNRFLNDPWRRLGRPALLMAVVVAQCLVLVYAAARAVLARNPESAPTAWQLAAQSPVLLVLGAIFGLLYLPVAMVSIGAFTGSVAHTLDPRRLVRTIVRMEHEYVYSVLLMAAVVVALGVVRLVTGMIPVLGDIVFGAALACATPMFGLILGRLLGRMGHAIE
jgi:hypothetical protein